MFVLFGQHKKRGEQMIKILFKLLVYGFAIIGVLATLAILHDELNPHGLKPVADKTQVTP